MANLTLSIDDHALALARKAAAERQTTVNALVRGFLAGLTNEVTPEQTAAIERMRRRGETSESQLTGRTWTRAELHDRKAIAWQ